jgi:predicted DCC family thiol-disulfide oxidoreductase YuxK
MEQALAREGMASRAAEGPVLLYDGTCSFCSAAVQFVLRHDRGGKLRFAPLQGVYGHRVLAGHPELRGIDSAMWVDAGETRVLARSAMGLRVARYLGGWWRLALVFWIVPRAVRDWVYDRIARHRHLLVGKASHCIVPTPGVRHRFLEIPDTTVPGDVEQRGIRRRGGPQ